MWGKALALGLMLMAIGVVVGGAVIEKAEVGLVLAKKYLIDGGYKLGKASIGLIGAGVTVYKLGIATTLAKIAIFTGLTGGIFAVGAIA